MTEKKWVKKFAWTSKQVRTDRRIWLKFYYEARVNGARYRREQGQSVIYKVNIVQVPE